MGARNRFFGGKDSSLRFGYVEYTKEMRKSFTKQHRDGEHEYLEDSEVKKISWTPLPNPRRYILHGFFDATINGVLKEQIEYRVTGFGKGKKNCIGFSKAVCQYLGFRTPKKLFIRAWFMMNPPEQIEDFIASPSDSVPARTGDAYDSTGDDYYSPTGDDYYSPTGDDYDSPTGDDYDSPT